MAIYERAHRKTIAEIKTWANDLILGLSLKMYFQKHKIYCKDGRVKKFDHHNLLKAQIDEIAKMIGVDDSRIFYVEAHKLEAIGPLSYVNCTLMDLEDIQA